MKKSTHMKWHTRICICITFLLASVAFAGDVELRLEDGSVWKGVTGQIVTIEYEENEKKSTYTGELTRATKTYIMVDGEFFVH